MTTFSARPTPSLPSSPGPQANITVGLRPHPDCAEGLQPGSDRVLVRMWREDDHSVVVEFNIERAEPAQLLLPAAQRPSAADGLWQHSCCEVFLALPGETAYREYNFSPSGQWAAYAFRAERERSEFTPDAVPASSFARHAQGFTLRALIPPELLPPDHAGQALQVGLATVLERRDQRLEYWAAHHPAPRPDFHHRASFCLLLPAPGPRS